MKRVTTHSIAQDIAARRARLGRQGFSLLEILAVIGIILVLVAIAVVTFGALNPSAKSTKTTLSNLQAMVKEAEGAIGSGWAGPGRIDAPAGPVTKETANLRFRYGPPTVLTRAVLTRAGSMPNIRRAIQSLPQKQVESATQFNPRPPAPTGGGWTQRDYQAGEVVSVAGAPQVFYVCTHEHKRDESRPPPDSRLWARDDPAGVIVLDAWNNPIIWVPGALTNVTAGGQTGRMVTSTGVVDATQFPVNRPLPAGARPFFASAGPDGDFRTGDDNVYSFEN